MASCSIPSGTCNDGLNSIRKLFPLLMGKIKIRTEIQNGALPGASLSSDGFHQFIGIVLLPVSIIGMGSFSDKHEGSIARRQVEFKIFIAKSIKFWHYSRFSQDAIL